MQKLVSFRLDDLKEGGLLTDQNVEVTAAKFDMFDYMGKADAQPAFILTVLDETGVAHEQAYTVGPKERFVISADKTGIIAAAEGAGINKNSNFGRFLIELFNCGFPQDKVTEKADFIVGLKGHVTQKALPKRKDDDSGREKTLLVFDRIDALPGEGGKGGKKSGTAKATASSAESSADVTDLWNQLVVAVLQDQPDTSITLAKFGPAAIKLLVKDPFKGNKQELVKMMKDAANFETVENTVFDKEESTITLVM